MKALTDGDLMQMYFRLPDVVRSEDLKQESRLKIALLGDQGSGKSWLIATAPEPIFIFDFDDRYESLAGKPGLIIKKKPSIQDVETVLNIARSNKAQSIPNPASWAIDGVTYMIRKMEEEMFAQPINSGMFREIKIGPGHFVKARSGWDAINAAQAKMEYWIAEFSLLGNIIFSFHEKNEKDYVKSTAKETRYTGEITVDPQFLAKTLSLFNEVFRVSVNIDNKHVVQCQPTYEVKAKTTLLLDEFEEANIKAMIAKHQLRRAQKEQK